MRTVEGQFTIVRCGLGILTLLALASSTVSSQDALPRISGRVVTVANAPIAGASVTLHLTRGSFLDARHWRDRQLDETTSDADGVFQITLPERSVLVDELFALLVTHADYAPTAVYRITPWTLRSLTQTVKLETGRPFAGTVIGKDGSPAADAAVEIYDNVFGQRPQNYLVTTVHTDDHGRYSFPRLAVNERTVVVARTREGSEVEQHTLWKPRDNDIDLGRSRKPPATGRARSEIERQYGPARSGMNVITGLDAVTRTPIKCFAVGVGRGPKQTWVAPRNRELFNDETGAPGAFALGGPPEAVVSLYARGYAIRCIAIHPAETGALGDVLLESGVSVSGRIVDPDGKPLANARVHVQPATWGFDPLASNAIAEEWYWAPHAFTDADGGYHIDHVPPGRHRLMAAHSDLAPAMTDPIDVTAGPVSAPQLALAPGGRIVGHVVNGNWLRIGLDALGRISVPLDGDRFEIGGLASGSYVLTLGMGSMCVIQTQAVSAVAGKTVEVEVVR